jgi:hypothetical protein
MNKSMAVKLALVCATILPLQGCFYQTVSAWDIERASKKCNGIENVVEISADFLGGEGVQCRDGTKKGLSSV